MRLVAGATTDVGRVREGNEDSFLVDDRLRLFAVADGMGGHRAGEVASATALEALRAAVASGRPIEGAVEAANAAVHAKAADDPELDGMGTTLVAAVAFDDGLLLVGHVGDSRAYLVRSDELQQLTEDHSLVEELVRDGRLTPEQAVVHPQRSIITRALGIEPDVVVDTYPVELELGDRVLLCTDGLTTMVRPTDIARVLRRESDPQRAADALVDAANDAGGEDNVTAIVIAVREGDEPAPPPPPPAEEIAAVDAAQHVGSEPEPEAPSGSDRTRRALRGAGRVARFAVPILLVTVVAFGAVGWYARRTYYVGLARGHVTIFKGVPGGLLGWDPTVDRRTAIAAAALTEAQRADLADGHRFSTRSGADAYVVRVGRDAKRRTATTSTTLQVPAATSTSAPAHP